MPSERVAIDTVGLFPVAKGGFKYILTYLNMATRWPEAVPLRNTTTAIVIQQLTHIFARNGIPMSLVSDNGPQFVSDTFRKFLKEKGIDHVRASPYHQQGNGVIERLHRRLNSVITKCCETKGNWAQIVPLHKVHAESINRYQSFCSQARLGADHPSAIVVQGVGSERHWTHRLGRMGG